MTERDILERLERGPTTDDLATAETMSDAAAEIRALRVAVVASSKEIARLKEDAQALRRLEGWLKIEDSHTASLFDGGCELDWPKECSGANAPTLAAAINAALEKAE